ncbi:hypothetical protein TMatcc_005601 [Talaromyces marneffei ATCC 18224]|uniref:Monoxygenase, putative n=3 Tax=Talaromyces marneffei TaxID=37727 RepID=B6Q9R6_TALMQ|nr:monoxygenase, putative [Talaromyces marneffei ATCC 18224]
MRILSRLLSLFPMRYVGERTGWGDGMEEMVHLIPDGIAHFDGPQWTCLDIPRRQGRDMNLVTFSTTADEWEDHVRLTKPAHQNDLLKDFEGFAPYIQKLLKLTKPDLDIWVIFDLGDHTVLTFSKGRICLVGDAAHATSPHHGSGAGSCIESSAILASMLASDKVSTVADVQKIFEVFDAVRHERCQFLVQGSRFSGDCYEWRAPGIGNDFKKIEQEINRRHAIISDVEVDRFVDEAMKELNKGLSA